MKYFLSVLLFVLLISYGYSQAKLASYNIRYNNSYDGDDRWDVRKNEVVNFIMKHSPEILGIQEGLNDQVKYIDSSLTNYSYVGVGRDDGKRKGEFAAIYFDTTIYELIETNTYWLSETPDTVSVGWDASMERITTYGAFKRKDMGDTIHVFNCHFDHVGEKAQHESAKLILSLIESKDLLNDKLVVMGDFNCIPESKPIQTIMSTLDDAMMVAKMPLIGPPGTFNGFDSKIIPEKRIDYIFTKNMEVFKYCHIDEKRKNGRCVSDHLPVLIEIKSVIEKNKYEE